MQKSEIIVKRYCADCVP